MEYGKNIMESPYGIGKKVPVSDLQMSPMLSPHNGVINQDEFMKTLNLGQDQEWKQVKHPAVRDKHHNTKNFSSQENPFYVQTSPRQQYNVYSPPLRSPSSKNYDSASLHQQAARQRDLNFESYER